MPYSWSSLALAPRHHGWTMARFGLAGKWVLEAVQGDDEKAADIAMLVVGVAVVGDEKVAAEGDEAGREKAVTNGVMSVAPGSSHPVRASCCVAYDHRGFATHEVLLQPRACKPVRAWW